MTTAMSHSQRVTLLYIQVIQDEIAKNPDNIGKFVDGLISKCPENEKEIAAAERWVRTGGVMEKLKQPQFNTNNEWVQLPRWRKRLNGFVSYFVMAFWSLRLPEVVDWVLYNNLRDEFLDESNNLKCCGNCILLCDRRCPKKENVGPEQFEYYPPDYVCGTWEFDNRNYTQRFIR